MRHPSPQRPRFLRYDFPSPWWDKISKDAKDLVTKLLEIDVKKRLTAEEVSDPSPHRAPPKPAPPRKCTRNPPPC